MILLPHTVELLNRNNEVGNSKKEQEALNHFCY